MRIQPIVPVCLCRVLVDGDDFLILASDGLWDTMSNQEAADIVVRCADKMGLQSCAELLTATSIRKGSMDNTSAVVVDIRSHRRPATTSSSGLSSSSTALHQRGLHQGFSSHIFQSGASSGTGQRGAHSSTRPGTAHALVVKENDSRRVTTGEPGNRGPPGGGRTGPDSLKQAANSFRNKL